MKRSVLIIIILLLAIGFATLSTTLIINGNAKVGENTDDFSVIFTAATLDGKDVYNQVINDTKKIITFETSDLKTLNQTSVLKYEVTNNSANYDAEVQINCRVKDDAEAKYTSIKNELENNATKVLAKESVNGTLTVTLNKTATEEVKEEYVCELTFNAIERDTLGENIPAFTKDSWETIAANVKSGNTRKYSVGDTREVDLGSLGIHTVRISNMSECTNGETSETACGFVVEFVDVITKHMVNSSNKSKGGWRDSELRTYVNGTMYNSLPSDLQNVISTTKVISSHGSEDSSNFQTQDKLYLLSTQEVWGGNEYDTAVGTSKQLDYYKNLGITTSNYLEVIKQFDGTNSSWWLRSANSHYNNRFLFVSSNGNWNDNVANTVYGISPAFRIA